MENDVKSAVAEIESTTDLLGRMADAAERKVIRMTWDEWRASRGACTGVGAALFAYVFGFRLS